MIVFYQLGQPNLLTEPNRVSPSCEELLFAMVIELAFAAIGVIVGLPVALFGFMRLEEQPSRLSAIILVLGLLITFGPAFVASFLHYQAATGTERYGAW